MNDRLMRVLLGMAGIVVLLLPAMVGAQAQNDHMKCYKVHDALALVTDIDLDTPLSNTDAFGCRVGKAKYFCTAANTGGLDALDKKTHQHITPLPVSGPDPGDRICYAIKCTSGFFPQIFSMTDRFGNRSTVPKKLSLLCTPAVRSAYQRFVDNGDGTVTDRETGLQWEKKTSSVGSGQNYADPHDVDNFYEWTASGSPYPQDGSAFASFLAELNDCTSADGSAITGGFAGHCDWRLPTAAELNALLLAPFPCGSNPCIDPAFGPTFPGYHWSVTTQATNAGKARMVAFDDGTLATDNKSAFFYVRAVRGGF